MPIRFIVLIFLLFVFDGVFSSIFSNKDSIYYASFNPKPSLLYKPLNPHNLLMPYLFSVGLSFNFNHRDLFMGTSIGLIERNLKLGLFLGYDRRPKVKTIYELQPNGYLFYEYKEMRSLVYLALEKRFSIEINLAQVGLFIGAKEMYSFGQYKNTGIPLEEKYYFTPQVGLFWMNYDVSFRLSYEYFDFKILDVPSHRMNFNFLFFIPVFDVPTF